MRPPPLVFFQNQGRQTQLVGLAQDLRPTQMVKSKMARQCKPLQLNFCSAILEPLSEVKMKGQAQNPAPQAVLIFV